MFKCMVEKNERELTDQIYEIFKDCTISKQMLELSTII